jgi:hypothetical protein
LILGVLCGLLSELCGFYFFYHGEHKGLHGEHKVASLNDSSSFSTHSLPT